MTECYINCTALYKQYFYFSQIFIYQEFMQVIVFILYFFVFNNSSQFFLYDQI